MADDEHTVGGQAQVHLDAVGPGAQARRDCGDGVLDTVPVRRAAMGEDAHAATIPVACGRMAHLRWTTRDGKTYNCLLRI